MAKPNEQKEKATKEAPKQSEAAKAAEEAKKKAKEAAEQLKKEKEEAAEAKKKAAEEAKAAKEKEKAEKAEAAEAAKAEREKIKGGPGKLLRSLIARIKYMRYMDNPSSTLEGIEALTWELQLTNSEGTVITVKRGTTIDEVEVTTKEQGKKAVTSVIANDDDTLVEFFGNIKP